MGVEIIKDLNIDVVERGKRGGAPQYPWASPDLGVGDGFKYRGTLKTALSILTKHGKKTGRTFAAGERDGAVYIKRTA